MSNGNVRGINDVRDNDRQYQQNMPPPPPPDDDETSFFLGGNGAPGPHASPYPPLNKVLAPNYYPYTFIFIMTAIQICVFIIELIIGQIYEDGAFVSSNDMAGPSSTTLKLMGGKYLPCIQDGEIYRFFTPCFLHSGILHIFTNLLSQTMIGYTCEMYWGFWAMAFFYFATTLGASLLSCVGTPCGISVGASGALLGIIGVYQVWLLLNWNDFLTVRNPGVQFCTLIWWLFIIFIIGISDTGIDSWAHFGGWLSGIFLGLAFCRANGPVSWIMGREYQYRITGMTLVACYFIVFLICTFLAISVSDCSPC